VRLPRALRCNRIRQPRQIIIPANTPAREQQSLWNRSTHCAKQRQVEAGGSADAFQIEHDHRADACVNRTNRNGFGRTHGNRGTGGDDRQRHRASRG
jgi:hypothetical protein